MADSDDSSDSSHTSFWKRSRRYVAISLSIFVLLVLILVFLSRGPQNQAFLYQIF